MATRKQEAAVRGSSLRQTSQFGTATLVILALDTGGSYLPQSVPLPWDKCPNSRVGLQKTSQGTSEVKHLVKAVGGIDLIQLNAG